MADRPDRLAGVDERLDESHRPLVRPQLVRVGHAARQHERVVIVGVGLVDRTVDRVGAALVHVLHGLDLPGLDGHQVHLGAGLLDRAAGLGVLDLLDPVGRQEGHPSSVQLSRHGVFTPCRVGFGRSLCVVPARLRQQTWIFLA